MYRSCRRWTRSAEFFGLLSLLAMGFAGSAALAAAITPLLGVPSDYEVTTIQGANEARNLAHDFSAAFGDDGVRIRPQSSAAPWEFGVALREFGWAGDLRQLGAGSRVTFGSRINYVRPGLVEEWYVNSERGLEHGFEVNAAPAGKASDGTLWLELAVAGGLLAQLGEDGHTVELSTAEGQPVLRYGLRHAIEALGATVPSHFERILDEEGKTAGLRLVLDVARASYPVGVLLVAASPKIERQHGEQSLVAPLPILGEPEPLEPAVAPSNDTCAAAIDIPNGSLPVLTTATDVIDATTTGDPAFCAATDRTIWYTFTAPSTGNYMITDCAASGAAGTTMPDTVIAVYNTAGGCAAPGAAIACNDTDIACSSGTPADQSTVSVSLTGGTQYFILAGRYSGVGNTPPAAGFTSIQLQISLTPPPANDTCAAPTALLLDTPVEGTTVAAVDDYRSPSLAACFAGTGNALTTSPGRDVVYRFTAPAAGSYSFRANLYSTLQNVALYVASDCPAGAPPQTATCVASGGANRSQTGTLLAEEAFCLPLGAGQIVFVYVDDATAANAGSTFNVEVNVCLQELEANGTTGTANALACGIEGSVVPAGDVDFYQIGTPPAGHRVFALADGVSAPSTNFDMRVATAADTLEYDNDNNSVPFGGLAPNVGGTPLTGAASFLRLNHNSAATQSEPYRIYSVVQPPLASATPGVEPDTVTPNTAANNYFSASIAPPGGAAGDFDLYRFCADAGDLLFASVDADPLRNATPIDPAIFLFDQFGAQILGLSDLASTSSTTSGAGSLTAVNPFSPAEALTYRTRYSGTYFLGVNTQVTTAVGSGDYLLSISTDCQTGSQRTADLSVVKTDDPDPVDAGAQVLYEIEITNAGPNTALDAFFTDVLPASLTLDQLFGPGDWGCSLDGQTLVCGTDCMAPGTVTFFAILDVGSCLGEGFVIENTVTVSSTTSDPNATNNSSTTQTSVADPGTCEDGDPCTENDTCSGQSCVGGPPATCEDFNPCTVDSCATATGCVNTYVDTDSDGACDFDDCAPADAGVFAAPQAVTILLFSDKTTLLWSSAAPLAGPATVHDVVRGALDELPVGAGGSEFCFDPDDPAATATEASDPAPDTGFWYLVRGQNACGTGTYGYDGNGSEQITAACP